MLQWRAGCVERRTSGSGRGVGKRALLRFRATRLAPTPHMAEQLRIPIRLMPVSGSRELIEALVALHTQENLPGIITDPDRTWECEWCPVRLKCEELNGGPAGKAALEEEVAPIAQEIGAQQAPKKRR
jgi:hypothetical protein